MAMAQTPTPTIAPQFAQRRTDIFNSLLRCGRIIVPHVEYTAGSPVQSYAAKAEMDIGWTLKI
jgi:hypothetical protein